jgi:hypothetical protein
MGSVERSNSARELHNSISRDVVQRKSSLLARFYSVVYKAEEVILRVAILMPK